MVICGTGNMLNSLIATLAARGSSAPTLGLCTLGASLRMYIMWKALTTPSVESRRRMGHAGCVRLSPSAIGVCDVTSSAMPTGNVSWKSFVIGISARLESSSVHRCHATSCSDRCLATTAISAALADAVNSIFLQPHYITHVSEREFVILALTNQERSA